MVWCRGFPPLAFPSVRIGACYPLLGGEIEVEAG